MMRKTIQNLTRTLLKFLECKFNVSETAKELYIHRNTLINRMNKIKELLYNDLESMDTLIPLVHRGICVSIIFVGGKS